MKESNDIIISVGSKQRLQNAIAIKLCLEPNKSREYLG